MFLTWSTYVLTHWNKVYWFYWGRKIRFDHWLLFGEYCQLHEDQGRRSSSCPINDFQVWQEEKEDEVFKVFVLLAWEISDFKDEWTWERVCFEWRGLIWDTIYCLIVVIYYFWYFYVKNVILGLGDLFCCF